MLYAMTIIMKITTGDIMSILYISKFKYILLNRPILILNGKSLFILVMLFEKLGCVVILKRAISGSLSVIYKHSKVLKNLVPNLFSESNEGLKL
jgi:hypothetical protein